ncbi:MAG: protein kinase [Pirellulales bacterium]|nr:protein kinase [Pirellulales bacterium]
MVPVNAEQIGQRAFDLGLITESQLRDVWASFGSRSVDVELFLQTLLRRELLTNYQKERLLNGDRTGFFYDKYKVLYFVGSGTFARVFRAVHNETGEVRALKVLRKRFSDQPAQYVRFVREGRVGCSLRHPGIVRVDDVISHGRMHYMVMEFVEGRNLREFVRVRGKLHTLEATRLMLDITDGMRYAFEHGVTHRDLKMSNVLVSSRGQAKLVDFGLAALDEMLTEDELDKLPNVRTIDYAALERVTGVRKDDTRSDIYFLGCIYYNMLTGVPPLVETRDRLQRLSRQRLVEVVPILKLDPSIPHLVAIIVNKAMALDPSRRYQSPATMLADLEIAARRLQEMQAEQDRPALDDTQVESGDSSPSLAGVPIGYTLLVVESDGQMQDIFRKGFKKAGYKVLLTSDPHHALSRLDGDPAAADCVVFNAQLLGQSALKAFNDLGRNGNTAHLPAVLLLDEMQKGWKAHAKLAPHRLVLDMPLKMRQLREHIGRLLLSLSDAKKPGAPK